MIEAKLSEASLKFAGSGISITTSEQRFLGAAIGSEAFDKSFVRKKVSEWVTEVKQLHVSDISITHPHSAYVAFTHGLSSKWTFICRTVSNIQLELQPLEDVIHKSYLLNLTGQSTFNCSLRDLIALPARLGGLGITQPVDE